MELDFLEIGDGETVLTILHGLFGSSHNWQTIGRKLAVNRRIILPSLRNHGVSPHGPHTLQLMCTDLTELMTKQKLQHTHLMGHSMGGLVAMVYAVLYPINIDSLIIVDVPPVVQINRMDWVIQVLLSLDLDRVKRREDAERLLARSIAQPVHRQFLLKNLKRRGDGTFYWGCNLVELQRFARQQPCCILSKDDKFNGPTLFIGGASSEQNLPAHSASIRHHFPNSHLEMIPDAGHWLHFEAPEKFLSVVTDFLRSN